MRLVHWRLRLVEFEYEVDHRLWTTHKVAGGVSRLGRSKEKQDVVDDEALCFVTESSPGKDAAQLKHREALTVFSSNTEAETRTERTTPSTVLQIKKEPVTPDPFT